MTIYDEDSVPWELEVDEDDYRTPKNPLRRAYCRGFASWSGPCGDPNCTNCFPQEPLEE
jgi:hypothetical protein